MSTPEYRPEQPNGGYETDFDQRIERSVRAIEAACDVLTDGDLFPQHVLKEYAVESNDHSVCLDIGVLYTDTHEESYSYISLVTRNTDEILYIKFPFADDVEVDNDHLLIDWQIIDEAIKLLAADSEQELGLFEKYVLNVLDVYSRYLDSNYSKEDIVDMLKSKSEVINAELIKINVEVNAVTETLEYRTEIPQPVENMPEKTRFFRRNNSDNYPGPYIQISTQTDYDIGTDTLIDGFNDLSVHISHPYLYNGPFTYINDYDGDVSIFNRGGHVFEESQIEKCIKEIEEILIIAAIRHRPVPTDPYNQED